MVKIEMRAVASLKPNAKEVERHNDPVATRHLGENMKLRGQLAPIGITEDGEIIYGNGRYLAALAAGVTELEAKVYPSSLSETDKAFTRSAENLQRKDYTGFEQWRVLDELAILSGMQGNELAKALSRDPS